MKSESVYLYFDDDADQVKAFEDILKREWSLSDNVVSNKTFGEITEDKFPLFLDEILGLVRGNIDSAKCVFLDLDFSGNTGTSISSEPDAIGFRIGRKIRKNFPSLPIIIVSRYSEKEILRKGLIFDFDNMVEPLDLIQMSISSFEGLIRLAVEKRESVISSVGDLPISYQLDRNKYFRRVTITDIERPFVFVAMPFDENLVSDDVWQFGINQSITESGFTPYRVDFDERSLPIFENVVTMIFESELIVADLTGWNANVLYEVGLAHAANKEVVLIAQKENEVFLPFDVRHNKAIIYDSAKSLKAKLSNYFEAR